MANNNRGRAAKFSATPKGVTEALGFFSGVNSTAERVGLWDIRAEALAGAVLGLVGAGYSVGFYTQWHGEAIVIRIYKGEGKDDHLARDAVEFMALVDAIVGKLKADGADLPY